MHIRDPRKIAFSHATSPEHVSQFAYAYIRDKINSLYKETIFACVPLSAWLEAKVTRGAVIAWEPAANSRTRRLGFAWLARNCNLLELSSFIGDRDGAKRTRGGPGNFYAPPIWPERYPANGSSSSQINGTSLVKGSLIGTSSCRCRFEWIAPLLHKIRKPLYYTLKTRSSEWRFYVNYRTPPRFDIRFSIFFPPYGELQRLVHLETRYGRKNRNIC